MKSATLSQITAYFRSCYQADSRAVSLVNFFSFKVKSPLILESAELLEGKLNQFPIDSVWGQKVSKQLDIYSKEKTLYTCPFFLVGKTFIAGKRQKVLAPLYLYPTDLIIDKEIYYLQLQEENAIINPAIAACFPGSSKDETGLYEQLLQSLPKGYIGFDGLHFIEETFKKLLPEVNIAALETYPKLYTKDQIKVLRPKIEDDFLLLPALGVGLLDKSISSRGVLNELNQMAEEQVFSSALSGLFSSSIQKPKYNSSASILTPVSLSKNQLGIFKSVARYPMTLVNGPPGTGKSFTIAALATYYMSQGKSVLISSKNNQAVDVVADKIEQDLNLPGIVVRAGRKNYKKLLQKRLEDWLNNVGVEVVRVATLKAIRWEVSKLERQVAALEKSLKIRAKEEIKRGQFLANYQGTFLQKLQRWWMERQMNKELMYWEEMELLEELMTKKKQSIQQYIHKGFQSRLYGMLYTRRAKLQNLLKALRARTGNRKADYFKATDFRRILAALPIWIVAGAEISQVLPLQKELFDLVIIDEATQCDIASMLPLLQRAKKAVVVGDPKQLRHLSFLSSEQQRLLIQQHELSDFALETLDYRNNSLLDLVAENIHNQEQVHFLNEHYRSLPDIIRFSNNYFYQNALHIMTKTPSTNNQQNIFVIKSNGKRFAKGHNKKEAEDVVAFVEQLSKREEALNEKSCQSIGILSPFREQVNAIQKLVEERLDHTLLQKHRLLIGTPYAFQGEERDIMLLSFAVDKDSHPSSFQYLNREDIFNVAITRARGQQHLFISFDEKKLKSNYLIKRYIEQIGKEISIISTDNKPIKDYFLEELKESISVWKLDKVYQNYLIAGVEIDLVIVKKGKTYCIDLIGYPGALEAAFPIERYKMLNRIGVGVFPLPFSRWELEREVCLDALRHFLQL